jgi:hypothetical protein
MREIIANYKTLRNALSTLINRSGYRNAFIAEKIGMAPNHFYVKKRLGNWNEEEIDKVLKIIENEELENYFLGQLMNEINKDEVITLDELKGEMNWK